LGPSRPVFHFWRNIVNVFLSPQRAPLAIWHAACNNGRMTFPAWLPILLGFLTAVGPATTDMYLPAFPALEHSFGAPPGSAQLTLAAWFAGLSIGQLTQGTLSDRFGRKRPLVVATSIYTVACLGCSLAPSIQWLAAFRALAAVGASAGMVIPRAMVRDLAEGHAAAVLLSRLSLVMGAAPILAPTLGSAVLAFADWRGIFWILTTYGATCLVLTLLFLPDTLPPERRIRLHLGEQLARYRSILAERGFLTHASMGGFATFAFFAYLGGSSPVFIQGFGLSPSRFAMIFGANSFGLICCAQLNPHLLRQFGHFAVLHWVSRVHLCAVSVLTAVAFAQVHVLSLVIAPLIVAISCMGMLNPNTIVGALARHQNHAGSASSVMGTGQYLLGAISGLLVGFATDGTPRGMAALMLLGSLGMAIADKFRPHT
jgi:DHA1 family bicyclomycin/chloramphenicol resistance-like MFS transporter